LFRKANVFQHPDAIAAVQIRRDDGVQRIDDAPMLPRRVMQQTLERAVTQCRSAQPDSRRSGARFAS
jgi:hypothetical protein